jgi:hypothetical protein
VQQRFEQQQQQEDMVAATSVHLVYTIMSNTAVGCNKPRQLARMPVVLPAFMQHPLTSCT